jgi:hypothetical protein
MSLVQITISTCSLALFALHADITHVGFTAHFAYALQWWKVSRRVETEEMVETILHLFNVPL